MQQKKTTKEEYQKCVNVVVEYINQHLGEDIDLKSLARISNFSPFYFHRIMKAFLGEPIGTFIVRTRTEAAARLLRYSDIPIADIAYRIGYSSPSSLSKVFRQFYGISPLEYRNNKNFVIMKPAIIRPDLELKKEIRNVSERNVIYIRLTGDYKLNDYGGTWGRLFQFIKEQKLPMGDFSPLCTQIRFPVAVSPESVHKTIRSQISGGVKNCPFTCRPLLEDIAMKRSPNASNHPPDCNSRCMSRIHPVSISIKCLFCCRLYFQSIRGGAPGENP